jgi:hypothetical protein
MVVPTWRPRVARRVGAPGRAVVWGEGTPEPPALPGRPDLRDLARPRVRTVAGEGSAPPGGQPRAVGAEEKAAGPAEGQAAPAEALVRVGAAPPEQRVASREWVVARAAAVPLARAVRVAPAG